MHMHVVHMSRAVRVARNRVKQSGADDVADLRAGMVVAVGKSGEFNQAFVVRHCAELLGEYRMGHPEILALAAAVGDAQAASVAFGQEVLEVGAQPLDRGRVHGCAFERRAWSLDPDARDHSHVVSP